MFSKIALFYLKPCFPHYSVTLPVLLSVGGQSVPSVWLGEAMTVLTSTAWWKSALSLGSFCLVLFGCLIWRKSAVDQEVFHPDSWDGEVSCCYASQHHTAVYVSHCRQPVKESPCRCRQVGQWTSERWEWNFGSDWLRSTWIKLQGVWCQVVINME